MTALVGAPQDAVVYVLTQSCPVCHSFCVFRPRVPAGVFPDAFKALSMYEEPDASGGTSAVGEDAGRRVGKRTRAAAAADAAASKKTKTEQVRQRHTQSDRDVGESGIL